jgi:hydroxymethylglutaryl-CoA lyase
MKARAVKKKSPASRTRRSPSRVGRSVVTLPSQAPTRLKGVRVRVFEVGLRDGLQNEPRVPSTDVKLEMFQKLVAAGIHDLEVGSFVRPDRVPQMADTAALFAAIGAKGRADSRSLPGSVRAWALVPNLTGLEHALAAGVRNLAVFTAASRSFNLRNIGMSPEESLKQITQIVERSKQVLGKNVRLRAYVSTAWGCPFEGAIQPKQVQSVVAPLADLPFDEISIGDTIGVATPAGVDALMPMLLKRVGVRRLAVHFHDTRGTALANTLRALEWGARIVDASAGGLGGCPFAPGATGNLSTEDLLYLLNGYGIATGIDLEKVTEASLWLSKKMERPLSSRYLQAVSART